MDLTAYALAKKFTSDTADSLGSLKGAPCTVKSITEIAGGHRVTLEWTGTSGAKQEQSFDVQDGPQGSAGPQGEAGYSPTVTVTEISGGHRVTITDAGGDHVFDANGITTLAGLGGFNTNMGAYTSGLNNLVNAQNGYTYDISQASNPYNVANVQQAASVGGDEYARYLQQLAMEQGGGAAGSNLLAAGGGGGNVDTLAQLLAQLGVA